MSNKKVIIVGGFHEVVELCEKADYEIVGIIDANLKNEYMGFPVLGSDNDAIQLFPLFSNIPLIITPDLPKVRKKLVHLYSKLGFKFTSLISPKANISKSAKIGVGTIIQDYVNVSSHSKIGDFVKLNTMSNVMHDCVVNDFVTIAPNAVLLGHVKIANEVYIGANSTVLPHLEICDSVTIGAGAVLTKSIKTPSGIYTGIPASLQKTK